MVSHTLNLVQVSLEDIARKIQEIVATELQKFKSNFNQEEREESFELMSRDEVAKLLKVSLTTLFNWNNQNILANRKIGRRAYYLRSEVMAHFNLMKKVD